METISLIEFVNAAPSGKGVLSPQESLSTSKTLSVKEEAIQHSLTCLFNSYVRDFNLHFNEDLSSFSIVTPSGELFIQVTHYSRTGLHRYSGRLLLNGKEIDFMDAVTLIFRATPQFVTRVKNSLRNMENVIRNASPAESIGFLKAEQSLFIGHHFHPTPKSREEFSAADMRAYGPEHAASFPLSWYLVRADILKGETSSAFSDREWQRTLYPHKVPSGFDAIPWHPWQEKRLLSHPVIVSHIANGSIRKGEDVGLKWFATSSLRSLYAPESPWMLKFSMSVKVTNSVRHLQVKEVGRGMVLQDALFTPIGREFSRTFPFFEIMHEPAYVGIVDESGGILPETIVLLRENIIASAESELAVLAALTQASVRSHGCVMKKLLSGQDPRLWFGAFVTFVIDPILSAHADFGIMLGAHQQNLLVRFQKGLPAGAVFRDCQGTAFSELGATLLGPWMPNPAAFFPHVLEKKSANTLFVYYLIINSVLSTIGALAEASAVDEGLFIEEFKTYLRRRRLEVRDPSVMNHLLESATLVQKGNFRCSLQNLNENTATDPLSIYNSIPNPFHSEISPGIR